MFGQEMLHDAVVVVGINPDIGAAFLAPVKNRPGQAGHPAMSARVLRESLVRLEAIPLIFKVPSMPTLPPGTRVQLAIDSTDLIDVDVRATYLETLAPAGSEPIEIDDEDLPEQMRVRREKRQRLLDQGVEPYPVEVARTTSLAEIRSRFPDLPPDTDTGELVGVTGRVIFLRNSGKLCFVTLREGGAGDTGSELQIMVSLAGVGEESLAAFKRDVDLGDHLFAYHALEYFVLPLFAFRRIARYRRIDTRRWQ